MWIVAVYAIGALWDTLVGLVTCWTLRPEHVDVSYVSTLRNECIADTMNWAVFTPSPWAGSSRAQTIFGNVTCRVWPQSHTRREYVECNDGTAIALDWMDARKTCGPILVVLPGVAGCSKSKVSVDAAKAAHRRGWRCVVYNRRGHGGSSLLPTCRPPTHANMDDMEAVVRHVQRTHPDAPMLVIGFSLGSNIVVKYLGELGEASPFVAGVSMCNGVDLVRLTRSFGPIANVFVVSAMRALVFRHRAVLDRNVGIDWDLLRTTRCARDFDRALMLPGSEFGTLDKYLHANGCKEAFKQVRIPLLCMSALDDPLIHESIHDVVRVASKTNENVFALATKRGGHLGWLTGWHGELWGLGVAMDFLDAALTASPTLHKEPSCTAGMDLSRSST